MGKGEHNWEERGGARTERRGEGLELREEGRGQK